MEKLFEKLNIKPNDRTIYKIAFSHSSYANEHKAKQDYERLEFLGDAILDMVISEYLYLNKREDEGEMTKVRSSYVCENALYEYATRIDLYKYIRLGNGIKEANKTVIADVFEAVIGVIFLEHGLNKVRELFNKLIVPYIEREADFLKDYKSLLQEQVQTEKKSLKYKVVDESGPAHAKIFKVTVSVGGIVYGTGIGNSKKEAEQNAAKDAFSKQAK
jgi:ribonuclease-3